MWGAGLTEGLMWRAVDDAGQLQYPIFVDIVARLEPFYWTRLIGGLMYLGGVFLMAFNIGRTAMGPAQATPIPAAAPAK
jgi:cbb3-type cytochrome oxidase subunit 1